MAVARKIGDKIEIQIGKDLYLFRSITWLEEMEIKELHKLSRERQIMAKALVRVSGNEFGYEECLKLMVAIPLAIFRRAYTIYRALEAEDRHPFKTINLYIAPEVIKVLNKVKMEDDELEETMNGVLGQDDEEVRETDEAIIKNSGLKGATKL
jgi:hypothetical protein